MNDNITHSPAGFGAHAGKMHNMEVLGVLSRLLSMPPDQRNAQWLAEFLAALWYASLRLPEDPAQYIFNGPDGFPYMRLALPAPEQPFQSYCIAGVLRYCFERGVGIALFQAPDAPPQSALLVLSMGQLDSLYRFGSINGDPGHQANLQPGPNRVALQPDTKILQGVPAPAVLPPYVAGAMMRHMQLGWKIAEPKASLIVLPDHTQAQNIMINATPADLPVNPDVQEAAFLSLRFYLPGHLALMPLVPFLETNMTPLASLAAAPWSWEAE
jgi:hypothetical protein